MSKVAVLLSSYNGDNYIEKQIVSIYEQSYQDFHLYIRDDGSDPVFVQNLRILQKKYGFTLIEGRNIGFVKSFMELLQTIGNAEYYAFADQDDIWLEDKLQCAVEWFDINEKDNTIPMLYHSAYDVIDDSGKVIDHFYFPDEGYDFRRSITENHYSGFSMVINQSLRNMMLKGDPEQIGYHDWWAAMIVQAFGIAHSDRKVTALHRCHGNNVTTFNLRTRFEWLKKTMTQESDIHKRCVELKQCMGDMFSISDLNIINMFALDKYHLKYAFKKAFSFNRWRKSLVSEFIMRILMLTGNI